MKVPGFTAEVSLYQTSSFYQQHTAGVTLTAAGVIPTLRPIGDGLFGCECVCIPGDCACWLPGDQEVTWCYSTNINACCAALVISRLPWWL